MAMSFNKIIKKYFSSQFPSNDSQLFLVNQLAPWKEKSTLVEIFFLAEILRARLQELRARRADLEKIREEIIKHLKSIHNRITLRRKEGSSIFPFFYVLEFRSFAARDMWKKKYFNEKKKTPPLEERMMLLRSDLEQIHKKTVQTIDIEAKHATQMGYAKEADIGVRGDHTRVHSMIWLLFDI